MDYIHFTINLASAYEVKHTLNELVSYSPLVIIRQVSDISSKIEMTGKRELIFTYIEVSIERVGKGDIVGLDGNPLDEKSITEYIPALQARGVYVTW